MVKVKENEDYKLIPLEDDLFSIEILKGDYKGVSYSYGVVRFNKHPIEDRAVLSFDFTIIEPQGILDFNNNDFYTFVGDILLDIMENEMENK